MRKMLCAIVVVAAAGPALAGGLRNDPGLILDLEEGSWRQYLGWKTPTLVTDQGDTKPLLWPESTVAEGEKAEPFPMRHSWYPPQDWTHHDFDDTYWPRTRGQVVIPTPGRGGPIHAPGHPGEWSLACLRGRFLVTDPKKVNMPRLELRYYGGVVIYVNGKELHRSHMPDGLIDYETPATPYPVETYVRPDGSLYGFGDEKNADYTPRTDQRIRSVKPLVWTAAVGIPLDMLRRGVNVISVECHAAPVNEALVTAKAKTGWKFEPCTWPHAGIVKALFRCGVPTGLDQNIAPSEGLHVGKPHPWETLRAYDYSHPWDEIAPVRLVGARNGSFSGRVLVSSRETIYGLRGTPTDLVPEDGKAKIPAAQVQIRYAEPCHPKVSWRRYPLFDRLLEQPPEEIPAVPMKIRGRNLLPIPTALCPVWVTVHVPEDAAPGEYTGSFTLETEDYRPVKVPVRLKVNDFRLPDPQDFRLTQGIYQSADSVAMYYNVEKWSDKHFELMGKSFKILRAMGAPIVCLNLCERAPNLNNVHSIVRWIKQPDGSFKYDFTLAERYLDLYEEVAGKPRCVAVYIMPHEGRENQVKPRPVTLYDPKTGKLESLETPPYGTAENREFWRPVLTELKERLVKRGWWDVTMMGHTSYCWSPTKETAANIQDIWPDGKWISSCHGHRSRFGKLPVLWNEWVWAAGRRYNPDARRYNTYPRPWRRTHMGHPAYDLKIARGGFRDNHPLPTYRVFPEAMMQLNLNGVGRLGGDFWPVPMGKRGRLGHLCDRGYALGHAINVISMISPGPDGAIWNERAEAFREGVQVAEGLAYVREMIDQNRVPEALAKQAEAYLVDRARHYCRTGWWTSNHWRAFAASGVHVRDAELYSLAAQIEQNIGKARTAKR